MGYLQGCNIDLKDAAVTTFFVIVLTLARAGINAGSTSVAAGELWYSSADGLNHGRQEGEIPPSLTWIQTYGFQLTRRKLEGYVSN